MRFVDTSFWVGLFHAGDDRHLAARSLWADRSSALVCTNHVLGETWTFLRRRRGHDDAVRALDAIQTSKRVTVTHVTAEIEDDAWRWLRQHSEREYSFVDATSFQTMRRRRITEALAFDGDFAAAGFVELRPSS